MNEDKASRYHRLKRRVSIVSLAWTVLCLGGLAWTGWSLTIRAVAESLAGRVLAAWVPYPRAFSSLTVVIYVALLSLVSEVGSLPVGFYGGYLIEHRYGLSNESIGGWIVT